MCAEYLPYVKFIATEAPTFFGYIISVLASVVFEAIEVKGRPIVNILRLQPRNFLANSESIAGNL